MRAVHRARVVRRCLCARSRRASRFWLAINRVIATVLFALLTGVVALQVLTRFVLHAPIIWSEEVARFLFFWVVLLGAAMSVKDRRHFVIDVTGGRTSGARLRQGSGEALRFLLDIVPDVSVARILVAASRRRRRLYAGRPLPHREQLAREHGAGLRRHSNVRRAVESSMPPRTFSSTGRRSVRAAGRRLVRRRSRISVSCSSFSSRCFSHCVYFASRSRSPCSSLPPW